MIDITSKKLEISNLLLAIKETKINQELLVTACFPRVFSHYEVYLQEFFTKIIEEIFKEDPKLIDLERKVFKILWGLFVKGKKGVKIFEEINNLDDPSKVSDLKKETIISEINNSSPHKKISIYIKSFSFDINVEYQKISTSNLYLSKKFRARCDIAHGNNIDDLLDYSQLDEFIKNLLNVMDGLNKILEDYLKNKRYLKEKKL